MQKRIHPDRSVRRFFAASPLGDWEKNPIFLGSRAFLGGWSPAVWSDCGRCDGCDGGHSPRHPVRRRSRLRQENRRRWSSVGAGSVRRPSVHATVRRSSSSSSARLRAFLRGSIFSSLSAVAASPQEAKKTSPHTLSSEGVAAVPGARAARSPARSPARRRVRSRPIPSLALRGRVMNPLHEHVLEPSSMPISTARSRRPTRPRSGGIAGPVKRAGRRSRASAACPGSRAGGCGPDDRGPLRVRAAGAGGSGESFWMTWAAAAVVLAGVYVYYATIEADRRTTSACWVSPRGCRARTRRSTCGCCGMTAGRSRRPGHGRAGRSGPGRGRRVQLASLKTGDTARPSRGSGCPTGPTARISCRSRPARPGLECPETRHADRHAQALLAADDQHRQAGLSAGTGHPHARPGAAAARPQAGRRPGDDLLPDRPARERRLPRAQSDQPVRDRLGRLPAGRRADRGELPRRLPRRRDDQPDDGRGQALRPAAVQGRPRARSAVLPAGPGHQGTRAGRLRLRQARHRRRP